MMYSVWLAGIDEYVLKCNRVTRADGYIHTRFVVRCFNAGNCVVVVQNRKGVETLGSDANAASAVSGLCISSKKSILVVAR